MTQLVQNKTDIKKRNIWFGFRLLTYDGGTVCRTTGPATGMEVP